MKCPWPMDEDVRGESGASVAARTSGIGRGNEPKVSHVVSTVNDPFA